MPGADFLQLDPDRAPPRGLADWLTATIRDAIADGTVPHGARLPSTRGLAEQLSVSRGVVVESYRRLADEGLIAGRRGGGTAVVATAVVPVRIRASSWIRPPAHDLRPGLPDLAGFPRQAWLKAERVALNSAAATDLGYGDPRGAPQLRAALTTWLARRRGVRVEPDDLIVVNGVAQALSLLWIMMRDRGRTEVAFEDPGTRGQRDQLSQWQMEVTPVPVDEQGLRVDALHATGLSTVVVTPAHQFPTGALLSAGRRRDLVNWARDGGLVIEDDYDADHRYDHPPVPALHAMAPDRVVHLGSVSKTLAPALRLGWAIVPPNLREEFADRKRWSDLASPGLGQLTLAELIANGGLERHLGRVRSRQRRRRDTLVEALTRFLPAARVQGIAAGLHLMVTLPDHYADDAELAQRANEELGVGVDPLSKHQILPGPPGFVIGYAAATPDRIWEGVRRLAQIL